MKITSNPNWKITIQASLLVLIIMACDFGIAHYFFEFKATSHFAFAVLIVQGISLIVLKKGEICSGQRSRFIFANLALGLFWLGYLLLNFLPEQHFIPMTLLSGCGLMSLICLWLQPKEIKLQQALFNISGLFLAIGGVFYLVILSSLHPLYWISYNIVSQSITGMLVAYLLLQFSRSRLQQFLRLLPFGIAIALAVNAVFVTILLLIGYFLLQVTVINTFSFVVYFALHLVIFAYLYVLLLRNKQKYPHYLVLFGFSLLLPLSLFVY